jgi:hypothetical protein
MDTKMMQLVAVIVTGWQWYSLYRDDRRRFGRRRRCRGRS